MFDTDPYPGKPRILFIGHASSTHTHAWLDLLAGAELNIRLFGLEAGGYPPDNWRIRTYLTSPYLPTGLDPDNRQWLHPTPEIISQEAIRQQEENQAESLRKERLLREMERLRQQVETLKVDLNSEIFRLKRNPIYWSKAAAVENLNRVRRLWREIHKRMRSFGVLTHPENTIKPGMDSEGRIAGAQDQKNSFITAKSNSPSAPEPASAADSDPKEPSGYSGVWHPPASSSLEWLEKIISEWRPNIVHSLGLNPAAFFFLEIFHHLSDAPKWVVQARGGPDLALNRLQAAYREKIDRVMAHCDFLIADNHQNYDIAMQMGLQPEKCCPLGVLPGTGGISVSEFSQKWNGPPSQRERLILWPKAYECPQSKALPVLEAIRNAWSRIQPCQIYMTAVIQEEIHLWYSTLPEGIRNHCILLERIPREEILKLLVRARVLLAPSLSDGIPNTLYEAMAAGAFPIVSPLDTVSSVVAQEQNALFARNLYPDEIAQALTRAMTDDVLVDAAAKRNLEIVKRLADRTISGPRVAAFYEALAAS